MYGYRVEFIFSDGESSYIDVYKPKKLKNPNPFDLLDFNTVKIDLSNVVVMKVKSIDREIIRNRSIII